MDLGAVKAGNVKRPAESSNIFAVPTSKKLKREVTVGKSLHKCNPSALDETCPVG
jgi:hypothetical protein